MDKFRLFPPQASTTAQQVDWLYFALTALLIFFTAVVFIPIITFAIRYRRGSLADRSNPASGSNLVETGWTLFPLVLSLGFFSWGAVLYYRIERPPAGALQVQVVGKQWMWELQHAEGKKEIDELHVPVGQTVQLIMTSQDVIHSFYVPAFRVKQDVVPGKYTSEWFHPSKVGEFHLFCAEYCGTKHSGMIGRVVVMEPVDYQQWLTRGEGSRSVTLEGERLFREHGCSGCHEGPSVVRAPQLRGIYRKQVALASGEIVTADDQYLRDSVLLPGKQITAGYDNVMPSFSGQLNESEIMEIIGYLKSLGTKTETGQ